MPGLLTHLAAAFSGFLIIYMLSYNWKYGLSWIIGTLIPDVIKFGIPGIKLETSSYYKILADPLFRVLDRYTHTFVYWVIVFIVFFLIIFLLYRFKKLSIKKAKALIISDIIFILSIAVHLIMDKLIIEKSYWI